MIVPPFVLLLVVFVVPFLYYLIRKDGPAVEAVSVERAVFESGELPAMCCKSAGSADAWVPVWQIKWFRKAVTGTVPIADERHQSYLRWKRINRRSRNVFLALMIWGFPLQLLEYPVVVEVALVVAVLAIGVVASLSNLIAQRHLAEPRIGRDGAVTLRGVHPDFVRAVQESRRDTRPAATADTP